MLTTDCVICLCESAPCGINPSPLDIQPDVFFLFFFFYVSLPWVSPLYLAQRRDSEKQGFCGDRTRLGSLTLMERLKRSDRNTGGEATVRTRWIFSQASHPVFPHGTAVRQTYICCCHVLWYGIVVSFIYIYTSMYFCLFFFLALAVLCVCMSFCAEGTTLIAEAPERVRQQRDQTQRDGEWGSSEKKRGTREETSTQENKEKNTESNKTKVKLTR